jgi:hypothetical protein
MGLGTSASSVNRLKLGLVFLALGVVLLLWAWGNWIYRSSNGLSEGSVTVEHVAGARSPATMQAVQASPLVLMVGFFLVIVFLVGSYAIVRGSRRLREAILYEKPAPTASDDVWSMHKAPTEE